MGTVLQGNFGGSAILAALLAQKRGQDAAPAEPILPPGTRVHGRWGQGCVGTDGIIVGIHAAGRRPVYWIVNEQGCRSASELHQEGALSPIGWYVDGGPLPGWEAVVSGWQAAKAAKDAAAQAAKEAASAAALALIAVWESETPGIDANGIMSAVGPGGTWRLWSRKGMASAREFRPGDSIVVGSYNLTYFGTLTKVTAKTICYEEHGKPKKALARKLANYNYALDLDREMQRNANWTD
jgi:hypothetical protein